MELLRSIASWATTGVFTVGAAAGIVLSNIEVVPLTPTAATVINAPVKSTPKAHSADHSFVAITASVGVPPASVRTHAKRGRRRSHPFSVTFSTTTVPDTTSTSAPTSSIPVTTTTAVTTTTSPDIVIIASPPIVTTTLPPATTTTRPPPVTTTTVYHHGGDGSGSGDT